ncbi:conjugal transfer protein TraE [Clostridia bacterium]|nr:conjugal transfer protein TraE [Clostridia bacterium]
MIAVRIPKDIRDYKEQVLAGFSLRQIVCISLTFVINVPLHIFGKNFFPKEVLDWVIMITASMFAIVGFYKKNGMPFEKYFMAFLRDGILIPRKRIFASTNVFREWEAAFDKDNPKPKMSLKKRQQASFERAYLFEQAAANGEDIDLEGINDKLVTVKFPKNKKDKKKDKKEKKKKKTRLEKLKEKSDKIREKQTDDPRYILKWSERRVVLLYGKELAKYQKIQIKKATKVIRKKNEKHKRRRVAKSAIPKTTQDTIPFMADYEEGVFEVLKGKYSKSYVLTDLNYTVAKQDDQEVILSLYCEFLNYFSDDYNIAITTDNRIVSRAEQEKKIFYPMTGDDYDRHRKEYNKIMSKQLEKGRNDLIQTKYVTVTIDCDTPYEAITRFLKIDNEIITNLKKLGSNGRVLSTDERLSLLHDKFRKGREGEFRIDYKFIKERGLSSKDYIAPASITFDKNYFLIEDTYYRCMYLNNLPTVLADSFFSELVDNDFPLITTINTQPLAQDKGVKMIKKQMLGMEADIIKSQKRSSREGISTDLLNHNLKQSYEEAEELFDDVTRKNQKMFFVSITFMVGASDLDELDERCKRLESKARKQTCQLQTFDYQQEAAFRTTLPCGIPPKDLIFVERALTTESTGIFVPFSSQEIFQPGGFYYGLNQITGNIILCNRKLMKTASGFLLGSSGSGKSFATKREILNVLLNDNKTSVLIIDPENEYTSFVKEFGGVVISVSADSDNYINPMDMTEDYGLDVEDNNETVDIAKKKEKALQKKSEYIMSIIECMMSVGSARESIITPQQKTIVDRCVRKCYHNYLEHNFDKRFLPTLLDLQKHLDDEAKDGGDEAKKIAEGVEYYTKGSMNLFSHASNIDFSNRLVSFNIRDLGTQLKQIALLIVLDFIWNRMSENFEDDVRTYCYVDEIHVLFQNEYSARFLQQLYKRGRKYGLVITGITQDIEDLLKSDMARGMISNSEFLMILNQSPENLKILAPMLKISETQAAFITKAEAGSGLLSAEGVIVPFLDRFPQDSYLYKLMTTKFGEGANEQKEG